MIFSFMLGKRRQRLWWCPSKRNMVKDISLNLKTTLKKTLIFLLFNLYNNLHLAIGDIFLFIVLPSQIHPIANGTAVLFQKSLLSSYLLGTVLLCRVVNIWRIGCIAAFSQNAYDLKCCKVAMEVVKKSLNHKPTPVLYIIWWLKLLNLFWAPTLPLPHTSPWCIFSFYFTAIGRNSGVLWECCYTPQAIHCGKEDKE